jgi:hypothetical protein
MANLPNGSFNGVEVQGSLYLTNFVDDSAVAGNRTVNAIRGKNTIALGETSVAITNSFCRATSHVVVTGAANNGVISAVVPSNGSFVVRTAAATEDDMPFFWWIVNN